MNNEEMTRLVNDELTHIPEVHDDIIQAGLRSSYNASRRHSLKIGKTKEETLSLCIEWLKKDNQSLSAAQEVGFALNEDISVIPIVEEGAKVGFMLGDSAQIRFTRSQIEKACEKASKFISEETGEEQEYNEKLVDERKRIEDYEAYGFNFEKGDYISGSIHSDVPINVYIVDNRNLERFKEEDEFTYEFEAEGITRLSVEFEIPKTRVWIILIENTDREAANVDISLSVESE